MPMAPRTDAPTKLLARPTRPDQKLSPLGVIAPPEILVESPRFSGSLATLFACVRDRKVDLLDVPLFPICEAYFVYLASASLQDLDEAASALAALAYLLERKAWALLPTDEPEPEAEETFELRIPTTHEYKTVIEALRVGQEEREKRFFRPLDAGPNQYELPFELESISVDDLARAFARVIARAHPEPVTLTAKPRRPLSEEMRLVLGRLTKTWSGLESLMPEAYTKTDAVYCFLAVLELIRLGQVSLSVHDDDVQFALKGAKK